MSYEITIEKFEEYSEALYDHSDFVVYTYFQKYNYSTSSKRVGELFFNYEEDTVKERFNYGSNSFNVEYDDLSYSSKLLLELDYTFCELNGLVNSNSIIKTRLEQFDEDEVKTYIESFTCSINLLNYIYTTFMPHDQDIKVFLCRYCEWLENMDRDGKKLFDVKPSETFIAYNVNNYELDSFSLEHLDESFETFKSLDEFWRKEYRFKRHWITPKTPPNADCLKEYYNLKFEEDLGLKDKYPPQEDYFL